MSWERVLSFRPQDFHWKPQALHWRPKAFHWSTKFLFGIPGFSIKFHWKLKVFFVETSLLIRDPLIFIRDPNEKLGIPKKHSGCL